MQRALLAGGVARDRLRPDQGRYALGRAGCRILAGQTDAAPQKAVKVKAVPLIEKHDDFERLVHGSEDK